MSADPGPGKHSWSAAIREMLDRVLAALPGPGFEEEVRQIIAPRNLAGLANPARNRLYPVDLEPLVENAGLLGLTREEVRQKIPRLRGAR